MAVSKQLEHRVLDTQESLHPDDLDGFGHRRTSPKDVHSNNYAALINSYLKNNKLSEAYDAVVVALKEINSPEYLDLEKTVSKQIGVVEAIINKSLEKGEYVGALKVATLMGLYSRIDDIVDAANAYYNTSTLSSEKDGFINRARAIIAKSNASELYKYLKNDSVKNTLFAKKPIENMLEFPDIAYLDKVYQ